MPPGYRNFCGQAVRLSYLLDLGLNVEIAPKP
jgi:hypothetical protein